MAKAKGSKSRINRTPKKASQKRAPSEEAKGRFLEAYIETCTVTHAARAAGVGRRTHYQWLEDDPLYAAAFEHAHEAAVDELEAEARRRAMVGVDEPVGFYMGESSATVRRYSDTLMIFLLKGARPEKYKDRVEATGKDGAPLNAASDTATAAAIVGLLRRSSSE